MGEVFPEAKYQRCTVHFYRNVFSVTPRSKVKLAAKMLKAIHAQGKNPVNHFAAGFLWLHLTAVICAAINFFDS